MVLKRALQPSPLRTLLIRSLFVAVVPLIVVGVAVSYVADRVILRQFEHEGGLVGVTSAGFPSAEAVGEASPDGMIGESRVGSASYYAIYTLVESHGRTPIVVAVAVYSYRSAESLTRPLEALVTAAQRIQGGELFVRLQRHAAHEIGALEAAFDTMALALEQRDHANRGLVAELRSRR